MIRRRTLLTGTRGIMLSTFFEMVYGRVDLAYLSWLSKELTTSTEFRGRVLVALQLKSETQPHSFYTPSAE
jgi:hypothetical protein